MRDRNDTHETTQPMKTKDREHSPTKGSRHIHLDCSSGIAGDMFLASLIDLGANIDRIQDVLAHAGLDHPAILVSRVRRAGISALHVDVPGAEETTTHQSTDGKYDDRDGVDRVAQKSHDRHGTGNGEETHHHVHRTYATIRDNITQMALPETVRRSALSVLHRLAAAESKVHGLPIDQVHFHEVGAVDTIADILGVCLAMEDLGMPSVTATTVALGSGTVRAAHGLLPVPAPATMELLRGVPIWDGGGVEAELTTPTGAALLTEFCSSYGPMPPMVVDAVGMGAGSRELEDRPNVLRAVMGIRKEFEIGSRGHMAGQVHPTPPDLPSDHLVEIRTNIDDMPAELLASLSDGLLSKGALDVWITPIVMKKGRSGHMLSILCRPDDLAVLATTILKESTAFGLRWSLTERVRLPRRSGSVETPWGRVDVMVATDRGRLVKASPEFESCKTVAMQASVPVSQVYRSAMARCEDLTSFLPGDDQ